MQKLQLSENRQIRELADATPAASGLFCVSSEIKLLNEPIFTNKDWTFC